MAYEAIEAEITKHYDIVKVMDARHRNEISDNKAVEELESIFRELYEPKLAEKNKLLRECRQAFVYVRSDTDRKFWDSHGKKIDEIKTKLDNHLKGGEYCRNDGLWFTQDRKHLKGEQ